VLKAIKKWFGGNVASKGASAAMFEKLEGRQLLSVSPSLANPSKIKVLNLFGTNGLSLNESLISVPFTLGMRLKDANGVQVRGYAVNPVNGHQKKLVIPVLSVQINPAQTNVLLIKTGVLMRKTGGKILLNAGALTDTKNRAFTPVELSSPKGQNKERFTLASRDFVPETHDLFTSDIYSDASAPTAASTHVAANTVATNFKAFMDLKVAAGLIPQATEDTAISQFNNTTIKSIVPDANLRAAVLSLYGTVGEPAIGAMLLGQNETNKPQTVVDFSTEVSNNAEVAETLVVNNGTRLRTLFKTTYAGEPFQALSAWVAHEALHQDTTDGQNEAIVTNIVETMVWAQQLDVSHTYVTSNTSLVKQENDKLYAMLDSGSAVFPRVGLDQGPVKFSTGGVFLNASAQTGGDYLSYEDYIRRLYIARNFPAVDTDGNATLDAMMQNVTGQTNSNSFNEAAIQLVDKFEQIITDKTAIREAGYLKLTIA
jgi:hypothetical protein